MARVDNFGSGSNSQYRRSESRRTYVYVDGTAVRKPQTVPQQASPKRKTPSTSLATRKNRERALQMNLRYVLFLTGAAVVSVFMCVNYLQLQANNTLLQKEVTSLEAELNEAILENDSDYYAVMSGIDMEYVKDVAMNQLGMVYAKNSQIVTYEAGDSDYVMQYSEIPSE